MYNCLERFHLFWEEKREIVEIEIAEKVENNASYLRRR